MQLCSLLSLVWPVDFLAVLAGPDTLVLVVGCGLFIV